MLSGDMGVLVLFLIAAESTIFCMARELTALSGTGTAGVILLTASMAAASILLAVVEVVRHIKRNWSVIYLEDLKNSRAMRQASNG